MLPKAIKLFKKQYPSIHLKLIQGDSAFIQEKLERQEIDCGIVLSPEKRVEIDDFHLCWWWSSFGSDMGVLYES